MTKKRLMTINLSRHGRHRPWDPILPVRSLTSADRMSMLSLNS